MQGGEGTSLHCTESVQCEESTAASYITMGRIFSTCVVFHSERKCISFLL